jgi:hypothetical protein
VSRLSDASHGADDPALDEYKFGVPIPAFLASELAEHLAGKAPDDLMFTTPESAVLRNRKCPEGFVQPLVRELAVDGTPVTVTSRVLDLARQPYYRWPANAVTEADWVQASRANALFDGHHDDREFGYRFLADEAREEGQAMADRTVWRICSTNGWWSVFGNKRSRTGKKKRKPGTRALDDLVKRAFTPAQPNTLWLVDITEHWTGEGKPRLCALEDCFSNKIIGSPSTRA